MRNIAKSLLLFLYFSANSQDTAHYVNEQVDLDLITSTIKSSKKSLDLSPIQKLIDSSWNIQDQAKSFLYFTKAEIKQKLLKANSKTYSNDQILNEVNSILEDYESGINSCAFCSLNSRYYRYKSIKHFNRKYKLQLNNPDYEYLKKHGLKDKERNDLSLGINYMQGYDSWIGADIAFSTSHNPTSLISKDSLINGKQVKSARSKGHFSQSICFSFCKNINRNQYQYSFAPIIIYSPQYLNLFNIGFLKQVGDPDFHWFYQPSIGFGYNILSVSCGYNLFFKRPKEYPTQKLFFQLKVAYLVG